MAILGIILLVLGWIFNIAVLWWIGVALLVLGVILLIAGETGHTVGGRRHWY